MQHTIEYQETHYIHAKKISNKQETPYEIQETHYKFQETIIMSKKIFKKHKKTHLQIQENQMGKHKLAKLLVVNLAPTYKCSKWHKWSRSSKRPPVH